MKKPYLAAALLATAVFAPVLAQAPTFSATSVRELGNFVKTLPTDFSMVQPAAAKAQMDAIKPFVLDVREPSELDGGRLPGAVNVPLRDLPAKMDVLPEKNRPIIVYCGIGHRGAIAMTFLKANGYVNVRSLGGGFKAWVAANLPVEK